MSETFEVMALRVAESCGKHEKLQDAYLRYAFRIRDELCKGQEPATAVMGKVGDSGGSNMLTNLLPMGTKLYLHPSPIPALPQDDTALKQYGVKLLREKANRMVVIEDSRILLRMADELEGKK